MTLAYQISDNTEETGLSKVFYLIERHLLKSLDGDRCSILLIESNKVRVLSTSASSEMVRVTQHENSSEDLKRLATIKWSTLSSVIKERVTPYLNSDGAGSRPSIVAPIFLGDYLRGVVYIARSGSKAFSEENQRFLNLFASKLTLLVLETFKRF